MDMRIPLAGVLVAGGLVGLAWPLFAPEPGRTEADAAQAETLDTALPVIANNTEPATWSEDVTLTREGDGHFYADVTIGGTTSRMLVDTGASVIALTGSDAVAMGLHWNPNDVAPVAQGASGTVYGVNTTLANVRLGNFEATNVPAMIIPEGLPISLLGQSFLSTIRSTRIEGEQMVLEN
ncbi:conserved hypothetical protein [Erythrobacter sp. EC-HK427]|nr:conserved hypothetical protein [Erythrobacter sp. EC-HK427]